MTKTFLVKIDRLIVCVHTMCGVAGGKEDGALQQSYA